MRLRSMASAENAETAMGTSCSDSSRRREVTTTSSRVVRASSLPCWARASSLDIATMVEHATQLMRTNLLDIISPKGSRRAAACCAWTREWRVAQDALERPTYSATTL